MRPRIRSIKPELWADEKIGALSRDARLLLLGLVTMADDEGRFRMLPSAVQGHVFPYDTDTAKKLGRWLAEVQDSGMILFYEVDGVRYGAFRNWRRHQRINRPTPSDLPPPPDQGILSENAVSAHGVITENSLSGHGDDTEGSRIAHHPTRRRAFRSDPIRSLPKVVSS